MEDGAGGAPGVRRVFDLSDIPLETTYTYAEGQAGEGGSAGFAELVSAFERGRRRIALARDNAGARSLRARR